MAKPLSSCGMIMDYRDLHGGLGTRLFGRVKTALVLSQLGMTFRDYSKGAFKALAVERYNQGLDLVRRRVKADLELQKLFTQPMSLLIRKHLKDGFMLPFHTERRAQYSSIVMARTVKEQASTRKGWTQICVRLGLEGGGAALAVLERPEWSVDLTGWRICNIQ